MRIFLYAILYLSMPRVFFADYMAQELFEAALFEDAATLLERQNEKEEKNRFLLAQCYFSLERFEDIVSLLSQSSLNPEEKQLLAIAYQRLHDHEKAIEILASLEKSELIAYHLGLSHFLLRDFKSAETFFKELSANANGKLQNKANIYLIRINLERGCLEQAEKHLQLLLHLDSGNPELRFLEGDLYFRKKQYEEAISCLEKILPKRNKFLAPWYKENLYQLGWSYLKLAEIKCSNVHFEKAIQAFEELSKQFNEEKIFLSLAESWLSKAKSLADENAYNAAYQILCNEKYYPSIDGKNKALLMSAEAAPLYEEREKRYEEIIRQDAASAECWYFRGVNALNEGLLLQSKQQVLQSKKYCKLAADFFLKSYQLFDRDPLKAALSLKFIAIAYLSQNEYAEAFRYFDTCIQTDLVSNLEDPLEIYYLRALAEKELGRNLKEASMQLQLGIAAYKKGSGIDKAIFLLAQMANQMQDFETAEKFFLQITSEFPCSPLCAQAYYAASLSAKRANRPPAIVQQYKQIVFDKYPDSEIAAECFFNYYEYNEYLQGDRKALKHLQALPLKFPKSPYTLNAHYLLGMDLKRDRKSVQGKWVSKKNLTQAIESFANVESNFEDLLAANLIPIEKQDYYVLLRYRSILERALANLAIAEEAVGAKRQIYLEYAGETFKKILDDFRVGNHPLAQKIHEKELFSKIEEESYYYLAKIYWLSENEDLASKVYSEAIYQYQKAHITKSYFLAKLLSERGSFAFSQKKYAEALVFFEKAAEAGNGNILNSDETLDLLIQQSLCLQQMNDLEEAMLLLSQVINCDVISSLRLKAMFLRANIYEQLGKPQLAKRQLETIVAKGGDWGLLAQEKLEKDYGFY